MVWPEGDVYPARSTPLGGEVAQARLPGPLHNQGCCRSGLNLPATRQRGGIANSTNAPCARKRWPRSFAFSSSANLGACLPCPRCAYSREVHFGIDFGQQQRGHVVDAWCSTAMPCCVTPEECLETKPDAQGANATSPLRLLQQIQRACLGLGVLAPHNPAISDTRFRH